MSSSSSSPEGGILTTRSPMALASDARTVVVRCGYWSTSSTEKNGKRVVARFERIVPPKRFYKNVH